MGKAELSDTAFLIAWGRSKFPKLSLDPFAEKFLEPGGIRFSEGFVEHVSRDAALFFSLRNAYITSLLKAFESINAGFTFANIGSGLTSYPFILNDTAKCFLTDQPHVLDFYRQKVSNFPKRNIEYFSGDLEKETSAVLSFFQKQNRPSFVLFEGILPYLKKEIGLVLLRGCGESLPVGSQIMVHVFAEDFAASETMKRLESYFQIKLGLPFRHFTSYSEQEIKGISGLKLKETADFYKLRKRFAPDQTFQKENLIDEIFFLLERV